MDTSQMPRVFRLQSAFPSISSLGAPPPFLQPHGTWDCYCWVAFHKLISLLCTEGAYPIVSVRNWKDLLEVVELEPEPWTFKTEDE